MNAPRHILPLLLLCLVVTTAAGQHVHICGELERGSGLRPGQRGLVDRFDNVWLPSKPLIEASARHMLLGAEDCGGFRIDFEDVIAKTGKGFDDPTPTTHPVLGSSTVGALRRRTVCEVFRYLGSTLQLRGSPDVIVRASQTDGSGFLAAASPFFHGSSSGFVGGTMFDHITTGVDPTPEPGNYDAMIIFDFGPWTVGGSSLEIHDDWSTPPGSRLDLYSITLHEATHTLGFLSTIRPDGSSGIGGRYSLFDQRLRGRDGTPLVDPLSATYRASVAEITSNGVTFQGERCPAGSPVYSPASYAPGSSLSHFDSYRSTTRYVMRYATGGGEDRVLTEEELRALCDIGYLMQGGICGRCAPTGNDDVATTTSGQEICVDVLANDVNPEPGSLAIAAGSVTMVSGKGSVVAGALRICYTPPADYTGAVTIVYRPTNGYREGNPTTLTIWVMRDRSGDRGLDSGLVAWWSFDDSTARDYSGNGNNGTLHGRPNTAPGTCGAAMRFDGINDYVRIPVSPTLHPLRRMTLSYWIKFHNDGSTVGNSIGNGSDDRPREPGFYTYTGYSELTHYLGLQPNANGIRLTYDATRPLDSQEYVHIVFVVSTDSLYLYSNGCLMASTARGTWPITRYYDWFIGWSGDNSGDGGYLDGMIDEIRLYDRVLETEEIAELYRMCGGGGEVAFVQPSIDFGALKCPRWDSTMEVRVRNTTDRPMSWNARTRSGWPFSIVGTSNGTLGPHEETTVRVRFTGVFAGAYSDSLLIDGGCQGRMGIPIYGIKDSCASSTVGQSDLSISKVVSDSTAVAGERVDYTIRVVNNGPNDTQWRFIVSDRLPAGLQLVSHSISGASATFDQSTGELTVPKLVVGEFVDLKLECLVTDDASDVIVNCAEIRYDARDPNLLDNKACVPLRMRRCDLPLLVNDLDVGEIAWCLDTTLGLVISNDCHFPVEIGVISSDDESFRVGAYLPHRLLPGKRSTIPIVFAPTSEGEHDGVISIAYRRLNGGMAWETIAANVHGHGSMTGATASVHGDTAIVPGKSTRVPIVLDEPLDRYTIRTVRITLRYDSTMIRLVDRFDPFEMLRGTLLEKWYRGRTIDRDGYFSIELSIPSSSPPLTGTGTLLAPTIGFFLGSVTRTRIDVEIDFPGNECIAANAPSGGLGLTVCGLNYRLIEIGSEKYALDVNRPNPVDRMTTIGFTLGLDGPTRLEIYDASGRLIAVPIDRHLPAGEHSVPWDATAVPSGVYTYRLVSGDWSDVGRLVVR